MFELISMRNLKTFYNVMAILKPAPFKNVLFSKPALKKILANTKKGKLIEGGELFTLKLSNEN